MRRLVKFGTWDIPLYNKEENFSFPYKNKTIPSYLTDGSFDVYGNQLAPADTAEITINFDLLDDDISGVETKRLAMLNALALGTQKLWSSETSVGDRFIYAKVDSLPEMSRDPETQLYLPIRIKFNIIEPIWYVANTTSGMITSNTSPSGTAIDISTADENLDDIKFAEWTVTTSPFTFSIINTGNLTNKRLVFRIIPLSATGWDNPIITNLTSAQYIKIKETCTSTNEHLTINCHLSRSRKSPNAGTSWATNWPKVELNNSQSVFLELLPGTNSFSFGNSPNTPNCKIQAFWLHSYVF